MEHTIAGFAHVLLFACPKCGRPLACACSSMKSSLEDADAHLFDPHCPCGWVGAVVGLTAVKHWVEAWPYAHDATDTSCESNPSRGLRPRVVGNDQAKNLRT